MTRRFLILVAVVGLISGATAAWAAQSFDDTAGDVHEKNITAIATAGITAGCTATSYCPSTAVRRDQMASFLARAAGLSSGTSKHFPVANVRGPAQSYCSTARANSASYAVGPCLIGVQPAATAQNSGLYSSIAIGVDEMPLISEYHFNTTGDLSVVHCGNPACTGGRLVSVVDNTVNDVGYYSSIAIGTDGLGVISYYDAVTGDLKVAHCTNVVCSASTKVAPLTAGDVGTYTSLAIGDDGLPVIATYNATDGDLVLVHCSVTDCSTSTSRTLDTTNDVGSYASLTIVGGAPKVAYYDATAKDLKLATCPNAVCTGFVNTEVIDSVGDVGQYASIASSPGHGWAITYYDATNKFLKMGFCAACTSPQNIVTTDDVGRGTAITFGADGLPVIVFFDATSGDLMVGTCSTFPNCGAGQTKTQTADTGGTGIVGRAPSITLGVEGKPIITYYDETNGDLRVAS